MKTLNEVLEKLEFAKRVSFGCVLAKHVEVDDLTDALHYLREYRKLDSLDAIAFPEDDNPPLSWQDLKQMEGKPVWVEGSWEIIDSCTEDYFSTDSGAMYFRRNDECYGDYGTDWQAYRKERGI